jgi:hypothetical protein
MGIVKTDLHFISAFHAGALIPSISAGNLPFLKGEAHKQAIRQTEVKKIE